MDIGAKLEENRDITEVIQARNEAPSPVQKSSGKSTAVIQASEQTIKFCGSCGNKLGSEAVFCSKCGGKTL